MQAITSNPSKTTSSNPNASTRRIPGQLGKATTGSKGSTRQFKIIVVAIWLAVIAVDLDGGEFNPPPDPPASNKESWEI